MAKKRHQGDESFGLDQPTQEFETIQPASTPATETVAKEGSQSDHEKHLHDAEIKYKAMGWKGLEDEDEPIPEEEQDFRIEKKPLAESDMDMTPMIDVTFLLLIFFMVTASFTVQKSLEQPRAAQENQDPSATPIEPTPLEDYVEILIDQNSNFYVTTRLEAEREAPSEREMRAILKDAKESIDATRLVIKAHLDCKHSRVITAWDAGVMVGMNKIDIVTTEQDF